MCYVLLLPCSAHLCQHRRLHNTLQHSQYWVHFDGNKKPLSTSGTLQLVVQTWPPAILELLRGLNTQVMLIQTSNSFIILCTCCESPCIPWASSEYSTSTEPRLVDSETVVYAFLQSVKSVLLVICVQTALMNIATTSSPVVDMVLVCVAGSHPGQTY